MVEMKNLVKFVKKISVWILWVARLAKKLLFSRVMAAEEIRQELNSSPDTM